MGVNTAVLLCMNYKYCLWNITNKPARNFAEVQLDWYTVLTGLRYTIDEAGRNKFGIDFYTTLVFEKFNAKTLAESAFKLIW